MEKRKRQNTRFRREAEKLAKGISESVKNLSAEDIARLVEEMEIRWIELELQNKELQRIQAELEKSRQRYVDLYDFAPGAYFTLGKRNLIEEANLSAGQLLGLPRDRLIGREFVSFISAPDRKSFRVCHRATRRHLNPETCELQMIKGDGTPFFADVRLLAEDDGKLRVALTDVSGSKRAEEALRENERDLNFAQAVAQVGSWRLNVRRNELTWSPECHRIFGITPGTPMTYETFLASVHPDDRDYVDRQWQAALSGEKYDISHRIVVNGNIKWIRERAELEFDEKGVLKGGFGIAQDITVTKQAEDELEKHRQRLEELVWERTRLLNYQLSRLSEAEGNLDLVIDNIPDGIMVLDKESNILFANPAAESLFGHEGTSVIGTRFGYPVTTLPAEMEIASLDGGNRILEIHAVKTRWKNKPGYLAIFRDITQRKMAEQKVWSLSQRLIEAQENERREIGHKLHDEVGGTLTVLKLALNQAWNRPGDDDKKIHDEINQIVDELTDQIRHISHSLRPSILDDYGLLEALQWYLGRYEERTGINILFQHTLTEDRLPALVETTVYRIIQEALTNAARYSGAGKIDVSLVRGKDGIDLSIKDDGSGFDTSKISDGNGIRGMKDLAELAGGSLSVNSSPGNGTSVTCRLPVDR